MKFKITAIAIPNDTFPANEAGREGIYNLVTSLKCKALQDKQDYINDHTFLPTNENYDRIMKEVENRIALMTTILHSIKIEIVEVNNEN